MKRLLKFILRLGVLVALGAVVVKLLEDQEPPSLPPPSSPLPEVAWVEPQGGVCPTSHPIKARLSSKVFRAPQSPGYDNSKPDRCYASEEAAVSDGFREAKR